MSFANVRSALNQYSQNAVQTGIESASPHRLIQMLMEGALGRIATAKGHMERGEIRSKGEQIGSAISILEGLKASLDHENRR
jgi:flagellar protein FliS